MAWAVARVELNGCGDDGNNSFDAFVFALWLDTGSANQSVLSLQAFEGPGIICVMASEAAAW